MFNWVIFINMTEQSTNHMNAFIHVLRQIGQISSICQLEKNFGKLQMFTYFVLNIIIYLHSTNDTLNINSHDINARFTQICLVSPPLQKRTKIGIGAIIRRKRQHENISLDRKREHVSNKKDELAHCLILPTMTPWDKSVWKDSNADCFVLCSPVGYLCMVYGMVLIYTQVCGVICHKCYIIRLLFEKLMTLLDGRPKPQSVNF